MDKIDAYIFKYLNTLSSNINIVARTNMKRHKQFLYAVGVVGAILWLQNKEIKELRNRLNEAENDISDLKDELFEKQIQEVKEVATQK